MSKVNLLSSYYHTPSYQNSSITTSPLGSFITLSTIWTNWMTVFSRECSGRLKEVSLRKPINLFCSKHTLVTLYPQLCIYFINNVSIGLRYNSPAVSQFVDRKLSSFSDKLTKLFKIFIIYHFSHILLSLSYRT